MILSDFHTHSSHSGDSDAPMRLQIESAISKGIKHLCFTEHLDLSYPAPPAGYEDDACDFNLNYDNYKAGFLNENNIIKKSDFSDKINLYFGIELGLQPGVVNSNTEYLSGKSFDFIIGSSHVLDGADPYYKEFFEDKDEKDVFRRYFVSIAENILLFDEFDVYGHLDYIVRYGRLKTYSYNDYSDEIDTILRLLIEKGKGIEINTGGIKNGLKYPNPCPDVIKRYKELGGEIITVGSDAHTPEYIAYEFAQAEQILNECGFKYYTIFKNRKPEFLKI